MMVKKDILILIIAMWFW